MTETIEENPRAVIGNNRPMIPILTKMELLEDHGEFVTRKGDLIARAREIPEDVGAWTPEQEEACTALGRDIQRFLSDVEAKRLEVGKPYTAITTAVNDQFNKEWRDGIGPTKTLISKLAGKRVDHNAAERQRQMEKEAAERRRLSEESLVSAAAAETDGQHTRAEIKTEQAMVHESRAEEIENRAAAATHQDLGRSTSSAGTMTGIRKMTRTIDRATLDLEALRPFIAHDALERAVVAYDGMNSNKMAPNKRDLELKNPLKGVTYGTETTGSFR